MPELKFTVEMKNLPQGPMTVVNPGNWIFAPTMKNEIPKIHNMELRSDDVWLLGLPKSGNTWATEMIWTVANDADTDKARSISHFDRWCFPEMAAYATLASVKRKLLGLEETKTTEEMTKDYFQKTVDFPTQRFIRSHLPLCILPSNLLDKCKVVYICRNPKDAAVSGYHMMKGTPMEPPNGFLDFYRAMIADMGQFCPWLEHIKEAWELKDHPNMFFVFYEDMKKDLNAVLKNLATFLGKTLTEEQVKKLEDHLSVESMRTNPSINMSEFKEMGLLGKEGQFIRKGASGEGKSYFTAEMEKPWQDWIDRKMGDTGFKFPEK